MTGLSQRGAYDRVANAYAGAWRRRWRRAPPAQFFNRLQARRKEAECH